MPFYPCKISQKFKLIENFLTTAFFYIKWTDTFEKTICQIIFIFNLGFQIAIVQGGIRNCGDLDYPGIFVRLDDPAVFNFINSVVSNNNKTGGKNQQQI